MVLCTCLLGCNGEPNHSSAVVERERAVEELRAFERLQEYGAYLVAKQFEVPASLSETRQIWMYASRGEYGEAERPYGSVSSELMDAVAQFRNLEVFGVEWEYVYSIDPPTRTDYPEWISFCDAHLSALRRLSQIRELYLHNTLITDEGLMSLADILSLKFIEVNHTFVTDSGIAAFRRRRPDCVVARLPAGVSHYNRVEGTIYGDGTSEKLHYAKVAPYVTEIGIKFGNGSVDYVPQTFTGAELSGLEKVATLEVLDLQFAAEIRDADIEPLYHLENLRELNLSYTGVSRAAVEKLRASRPGLKVYHDQW